MIRFDVLTLFPGIFSGYLAESLLEDAIAAGLVQVHLWNLRDWTQDKHQKVDDRPFGGGPGMVLSCQPVMEAVEAGQAQAGQPRRIVRPTPGRQGRKRSGGEELATRLRLMPT